MGLKRSELSEIELLTILRVSAQQNGGLAENVVARRSLLPWKKTIWIVEQLDLKEINKRIEEAYERQRLSHWENRWNLYP